MRHSPPSPATPDAALAQRLQNLETQLNQLENSVNAGYPWAALPLENWANYKTGAFQEAAYSKDRTGWVRVKGLVEPTKAVVPGGGSVVGYLPESCYPGKECVFVCWLSNGAARVDVLTSGVIVYVQGPNVNVGDFLTLNSIGFQAKAT